jgi:hypothetical protein
VVIYLDDILILHQDKDHLKQVGQEVLLFLKWLGWTMNVEKSQLVPARIFWYLGWQWNSVDMEVTLTEERIEKIKDELRRMRKGVHNHKMIPIRNLAKIMGILSEARIQFPLASLHLMKINAMKSRHVRDCGWNGRI